MSNGNGILTLSRLNGLIGARLKDGFPNPVWITAEVSENVSRPGHVRLRLVETLDGREIARGEAIVWPEQYDRLERFEAATGSPLAAGMETLILASVTYHSRYGVGLRILDISPEYTIGGMERRRAETLSRLKRVGLWGQNSGLPLPGPTLRAAVISSETAAGLGDFERHLAENAYGYRFSLGLFPALVQGDGAEASVLSALDRIEFEASNWDVAIIVRGGGARADLGCFDGYRLCARVAAFPLPVITGIGHDKDRSALDEIAHTACRTPTAVADFLVSRVAEFEENLLVVWGKVAARVSNETGMAKNRLESSARRIGDLSGERLRREKTGLDNLVRIAANGATGAVASAETRVEGIRTRAVATARLIMERSAERLKTVERAVRVMHPRNVLGRGFCVARLNGRAILSSDVLSPGDLTEIELWRGGFSALVGETKG